MTESHWLQPLFDGPIDVVGDVHGEIEPLRQLLEQLGYDAAGQHPDGRRLVFVGDLGDRGPDSPAVGEFIMSLVARGRAQCCLGNHELNLLRGVLKDGNAWFVDPTAREQQPGGKYAECRLASLDFKKRYVQFLATLPLALEGADLRVIHAAWIPAKLDELREQTGTTTAVYERYEVETNARMHFEGLKEAAEREEAQWNLALRDKNATVPLLETLGSSDERYQMANPIRVLTSGVERLAAAPFWSSGRWRMCDRVKWWNEYKDPVPVIVGHYWRHFRQASPSTYAASKPDFFAGSAPTEWLGPGRRVFCVDYSIGGRSEERKQGVTDFKTHLGALRWPERELWLETGRVGSTTVG